VATRIGIKNENDWGAFAAGQDDRPVATLGALEKGHRCHLEVVGKLCECADRFTFFSGPWWSGRREVTLSREHGGLYGLSYER